MELYADVSRPMGVGARLRLRDNVAITIPPSRLLPITTEGIKAEQWLLLELAELHAQQQRQSRATDARETHELDRMELWDKLQRERALEAFAPRQCRLKRGERFGDPVELDCLPDIRGQRKRERKQKHPSICVAASTSLSICEFQYLNMFAPCTCIYQRRRLVLYLERKHGDKRETHSCSPAEVEFSAIVPCIFLAPIFFCNLQCLRANCWMHQSTLSTRHALKTKRASIARWGVWYLQW